MHHSALVLFSGGQDSTTCLADALCRYQRVETVGFEYGQRHRVEMDVRDAVLERMRMAFPDWAARLGDDHLLDAGVLGQVGASALTEDMAFAMQADGLPNTFVPGRNLLFLTLAGALAYRRGLDVLIIGASETDSSGYPDCRNDAIQAMQQALALGLKRSLVIETPLMWLNKAQTWALAHRLGGNALVRLIIEQTHTCYQGNRILRHPWGYGCGACAACQLRANGWWAYASSAAGQTP